MPYYVCNNCNFSTYNKTNYERHLQTKKHFLRTENNKMSSSKSAKNKNVIHATLKNSEKNTINARNTLVTINKKTSQMHEMNSSVYCSFCGKQYKYRQGLSKHLKQCELREQEENINDWKTLVGLLNEKLEQQQYQMQEQKKEFQKMLDKRDTQINQLIEKVGITSNTFIQNMHNNTTIKLLGYKETDTSHLTDEDYKECVSRVNLSVPHLIQKLHFNKDKPENHNIYISNLKNKYMLIYDGEKWNYKKREKGINDLLDDGNYLLEYKIEEWLEKGNHYPKTMKKFKNYMKNIENDEIIQMIKDEIQLLLYNNRNLIKNE